MVNHIDHRPLFLARLEELAALSQRADDVSMLRIAAIIRHLAVDGSCLIDEVNRPHKIQLRFVVNRRPRGLSERDLYAFAADGLDPEGGPPGLCDPEEVKKAGLLAAWVARINGKDCTVHDVIMTAANVMGGVHHRQPKHDHEHVVLEGAGFTVGGMGGPLSSLRAVATVLLRGLAPLAEAIRKDPTFREKA